MTTDPLELALRLHADATARVDRHPAFTYLLDHALSCLEFRRALGPDCGVGDPLESFSRGMAALESEPKAGPWLYRGAAQAGWLITQLQHHAGLGSVSLAPLDAVVTTWLDEFPDDADFDLPRGAIGLGVYGLNHPDDSVRARILDGVMSVLTRRLEHDADGAFIRVCSSAAHDQTGASGCRVVGMAHGAAGLVAFLSSVAMAEPARKRTVLPMLSEVTAWLMARREDVGYGVFPHRVELSGQSCRPTWCSGDAGAAIALWQAAQALDDPAPAELARHVAAKVIERPDDDCQVADACFCHGAASLIWFGHRAARDLDEPRGIELADRWVQWVAERRVGERLRYFSPWGMVRDCSLLEGDIGVALALLQHATGHDTVWEELMLGVPVGHRPEVDEETV